MICFNMFSLQVCLYLNSSVVLHNNSMGSIAKKVGENQEVIRILFVLTGYLKTI